MSGEIKLGCYPAVEYSGEDRESNLCRGEDWWGRGGGKRGCLVGRKREM